MIYVNVFQYDRTGCGFYRIEQPYHWLNKLYGDIAVRFIRPTDPEAVFNDVFDCDVIVMNRIWSVKPDFIPSVIKEARNRNVKTIYDLDDKEWDVPEENPLYSIHKKLDIERLVKETMLNTSHVTCTTRVLKRSISEFNKNVTVIPNAIDYESPIWNRKNENKHDKWIRVGYVGGSSHLFDLLEVKGIGKWLLETFDNVMFCLCGYDTRVSIGGREVHLENMDNVWWKYIDALFSGYEDRKRIVLKTTLPIDVYPAMYDDLDIVIVPLKNNDFNKNKSELKLIEASGYGVAVVASNIPPYDKAIISSINGYLCNNIHDFKRNLTKLIKDENLRNTMGNKLRDMYKKKYDIRVVVQKLHKLILNLADG